MIDFNLNKGDAVLNSSRDLVIQQIEMLFDTVPTDVLGSISYGTRYDKFLYDLNFSALELQQTVISDLQTIDLQGFTPNVNVKLLRGTERDIILIKIDLYKNNINIEKIYEIS